MKKKDTNKPKKPVYKRVWFWILMFFIVCGIIGTVSAPPADQTDKTEEKQTNNSRKSKAKKAQRTAWTLPRKRTLESTA